GDGQPATGRRDAVADVRQPTTARDGRRVEPTPVVGDDETQPRRPLVEGDARARRARVLGHVGQGLGYDVIGGRLEVRGESGPPEHRIGDDLERDGIPRGARLDRGDEPTVAEHRRVDAVGDLTEVGQRFARLVLQPYQLLVAELPA